MIRVKKPLIINARNKKKLHKKKIAVIIETVGFGSRMPIIPKRGDKGAKIKKPI